MSGLIATRSGSMPSRADGSRGFVGWISTSNPFYALSALLVCLGLWVSFGAQASATHSWALLLGMAGYTLLLAATASLLVRALGVWDDVRTVLLLAVLMILATSVTFDVVLARDPARGVACYLGGLALAVALSEAMLRGVRLRLPALFRIPYYGALALFFVYPAAIAPLVARPKGEALTWALFGFSPAAALVSLTLLPAIRRGRAYVLDNGSPWRWAWYPWTLFGVLGFAVVARSALLCWSMHHLEGAKTEPYIFGPYFLAPFGLAVAVLLLEIGLVERIGGAIRSALAVPPILALLATVGHRPEVVYQDFLAHFIGRLGGTPLYLTLLAAAAFYAYAAMRRVPAAFEWMTATVGALAFVAPQTLDLGELTAPRPVAVLAVSLLLLASGLARRGAGRCLLGSAGLVVFATLALPRSGGGWNVAIAFHLLLVATLIVGAAFRDAVGRTLRTVGSVLALLASLAALGGWAGETASVPPWVLGVYPFALSAAIAGYGVLLGHRPAVIVGWLGGGCGLIALGLRGYESLRLVVAGLDYIALGMVLFGLAVFTSVAKSGALARRSAKAGPLSETGAMAGPP